MISSTRQGKEKGRFVQLEREPESCICICICLKTILKDTAEGFVQGFGSRRKGASINWSVSKAIKRLQNNAVSP